MNSQIVWEAKTGNKLFTTVIPESGLQKDNNVKVLYQIKFSRSLEMQELLLSKIVDSIIWWDSWFQELDARFQSPTSWIVLRAVENRVLQSFRKVYSNATCMKKLPPFLTGKPIFIVVQPVHFANKSISTPNKGKEWSMRFGFISYFTVYEQFLSFMFSMFYSRMYANYISCMSVIHPLSGVLPFSGTM